MGAGGGAVQKCFLRAGTGAVVVGKTTKVAVAAMDTVMVEVKPAKCDPIFTAAKVFLSQTFEKFDHGLKVKT